MIHERLKYIREKIAKNASQFADDNGIDHRTYSNYENGNRLPSIGFLEHLYIKYGFNIHWLITGSGRMYVDGMYGDDNYYMIPIQGDFNDVLGNGVKVETEENTGLFAFSKQLADIVCPHTKAAKIIFARGNSMAPTICDGDSMLIDTSKKRVNDGKIYCMKYLDQITPKRLQIVPPDKIKVISDNKEQFDPFYIDLNDSKAFEIIGEVRWWGRVAK